MEHHTNGSGDIPVRIFWLSYYHTLSSSIAFRIQNRANGQLWGLPALVPGTQVTLADPGAGANQLWFTS